MHSRKHLTVFLVTLSLVSFPLHFIWEWAQCQPYFVHGATPPGLESMLVATLGDVVLTLLIYAGVALLYRVSWPLQSWSVCVWLLLLTLALLFSVAIEVYALHSGRWAYTAAAPLMPGTSISALPVAQLFILVPLSLGLTRALFKWWRRHCDLSAGAGC